MIAPPATKSPDTRFFGQPAGLGVLFFAEMWERFSYYGMRALLLLYLTADAARGGLGMSAANGGAIYSLYTSSVYLLALPGGWIADRLIGQRRAVLWGGVLIALGHFSLALRSHPTFFGGLVLIVLGTGLLKPNISVMVGRLYAPDDERRDAGFSLFYMGINFGAWLGPLVCSLLGEKIDWHLGFAAAGVGMTLGLVVYLGFGRALGEAGRRPSVPDSPQARAVFRKQLEWGAAAGVAIVLALALSFRFGALQLQAESLSNAFGIFLLALIVGVFALLFRLGEWTAEERGRLVAIAALFLASAFFWGAYEQAGSTLSLFADRDTNRWIDGWEFPAGWFQQAPAIFVILQAPLFAWFWMRLGRRQPSSPAKFSLGLLFVGLGYVVMIGASLLAAGDAKVGIYWLLATYFLHVVGEMCLSPVGLSVVTKLAPARVGSLMMGVWFLSMSVGGYLAGRAGGLYETLPLPALFGTIAGITIAGAIFLALAARSVRRLMGGVH